MQNMEAGAAVQIGMSQGQALRPLRGIRVLLHETGCLAPTTNRRSGHRHVMRVASVRKIDSCTWRMIQRIGANRRPLVATVCPSLCHPPRLSFIPRPLRILSSSRVVCVRSIRLSEGLIRDVVRWSSDNAIGRTNAILVVIATNSPSRWSIRRDVFLDFCLVCLVSPSRPVCIPVSVVHPCRQIVDVWKK